MKRHYHVGSNVPGYLPVGDVYCCGTAADAASAWREDVLRAINDLPADSDSEFLEHSTWLHGHDTPVVAAEIEAHGVLQRDVNDGGSLPTRYWVVEMEGSAEDCDLHED